MNEAHLHLMIVHIPVLFVPVGLGLMAFSLWRKEPIACSIALVLFQVAAVAGGAAYLLGEGAEEGVEHAAGVIRSAIETHEDSATAALIITVGLGILSLGEMLIERRRPAFARSLLLPIFALSCISSGALAYTANQGGRIRHPEAFSLSGAIGEGTLSGGDSGKVDDDD